MTGPVHLTTRRHARFSFLDIGPIAKGHALVIPKSASRRLLPFRILISPTAHGEKLHDIPDDYLVDTLSVAKKIAVASGFENYNILQNNGRIAHQVCTIRSLRCVHSDPSN